MSLESVLYCSPTYALKFKRCTLYFKGGDVLAFNISSSSRIISSMLFMFLRLLRAVMIFTSGICTGLTGVWNQR